MPAQSHSYPQARVDGLDQATSGVSVVIASHRDSAETLACLETLLHQTLSRERFEVILVVNGDAAADISAYRRFESNNPELRFRIIRTPIPGACHALNLGIAAARMNWVTFVDDDDTVSPRYLEGLLSVAGPRVMPLTLIDDVTPDGHVEKSNRINRDITPLLGRLVPPEDLPRGLSFNASKLVPTDWARHVGYENHLRSGQDIAFYGALYAVYDFSFAIVPDSFDCIYHRALSDSSQSRRELDFEFAVTERLDVIEALARRMEHAAESKRIVLESMLRAQAMFIRRFLDQNPARRAETNSYIRRRRIRRFPWDILTRRAARELVVSVCFPPYSDASAVTVAKRIDQRAEVVDVICCNMGRVRAVDASLSQLVQGLVDTRVELETRPGFSNWEDIREFALSGWDRYKRLPNDHERVYSRAMWPASHVLAALIKARSPDIAWTAEFSDPLSRDVAGRSRSGGGIFEDDLVRELISSASTTVGIDLPSPVSVFELAELMPYALADTVVFTNESQMEYMLSYCPPALRDLVEQKASIRPHPIPAQDFYRSTDVAFDRTQTRAHLAYFGGFYENRSLRSLLDALESAPPSLQRALSLDVHTDHVQILEDEVTARGLSGLVKVHASVPYLEFLNLATKYDCLVVEDALTSDTHPLNPYLPSKWSDYRGSGSAIWALTEPDSPLDRLDPEYKSHLSDTRGALAVLRQIAADFSSRGDESTDDAIPFDASTATEGH